MPKYFLPSHIAAHLCHYVNTGTGAATGKVRWGRKGRELGYAVLATNIYAK